MGAHLGRLPRLQHSSRCAVDPCLLLCRHPLVVVGRALPRYPVMEAPLTHLMGGGVVVVVVSAMLGLAGGAGASGGK